MIKLIENNNLKKQRKIYYIQLKLIVYLYYSYFLNISLNKSKNEYYVIIYILKEITKKKVIY